MPHALSEKALLTHVRALAREIGPRPAGHPAEARARDYIRQVLAEVGFRQVEEMPFPAWDTWGYALLTPILLALVGNVLGRRGRLGKLVGGLSSLAGDRLRDRAQQHVLPDRLRPRS